MNDAELREWEEEHRHPHLRRSDEAWMNHRWNPTNYPGNKVGGVIVQDWVDPKTRMRIIVLDVLRRKRNVAVWISYPHLISLIDEAAPKFGERLGITFLGETRLGAFQYSISMPERVPAEPASQTEASQTDDLPEVP
jgi:hypothetical protein